MKEPKFSIQFPAQKIATPLQWDDLVVDTHCMDAIIEIKTWIENEQTILTDWKLNKRLKPGFRALFYGPEGTGKTLAASLLGQATARKVYRVDLSVGISKYIGETEKNLATVFDRAQKNNWILFFDEADALFGKRTVVKDAHDRYANQEVAYLLQRVEDYPGVVIFASNLKANIDEAFSRRFQSMIHFSMPNAEQRLMLWKKTFSGAMQVAPDVDWEKIAVTYEISGGDMLDVLQYCALTAVQRKPPVVQSRDILAGIRRVMQKHGKIR